MLQTFLQSISTLHTRAHKLRGIAIPIMCYQCVLRFLLLVLGLFFYQWSSVWVFDTKYQNGLALSIDLHFIEHIHLDRAIFVVICVLILIVLFLLTERFSLAVLYNQYLGSGRIDWQKAFMTVINRLPLVVQVYALHTLSQIATFLFGALVMFAGFLLLPVWIVGIMSIPLCMWVIYHIVMRYLQLSYIDYEIINNPDGPHEVLTRRLSQHDARALIPRKLSLHIYLFFLTVAACFFLSLLLYGATALYTAYPTMSLTTTLFTVVGLKLIVLFSSMYVPALLVFSEGNTYYISQLKTIVDPCNNSHKKKLASRTIRYCLYGFGSLTVLCMVVFGLVVLKDSFNTATAKELPLVIAHRGGTYPSLGRQTVRDNSIQAVTTGLAHGVQAFELDVRLTTDNQVIIFHDATYTDQHGSTHHVHKQPYAAIQVGEEGHIYQPDLLTDLIPVMRKHPDSLWFVELKTDPGIEQQLVDLVYQILHKAEVLEQATIVSLDNYALSIWHKQDPNRSLGLLVSVPLGDISTYYEHVDWLLLSNTTYPYVRYLTQTDGFKIGLWDYSTQFNGMYSYQSNFQAAIVDRPLETKNFFRQHQNLPLHQRIIQEIAWNYTIPVSKLFKLDDEPF